MGPAASAAGLEPGLGLPQFQAVADPTSRTHAALGDEQHRDLGEGLRRAVTQRDGSAFASRAANPPGPGGRPPATPAPAT